MPLGIIGRTGLGMRQVVAFGDRSTGRGTFGGEFGAPHFNQWGLYDVCVDFRSNAALFPNYFGQTCYLVVTGHCSNCCESVSRVLSSRPWLGREITSIWDANDGVWGCAPRGAQGQSSW